MTITQAVVASPLKVRPIEGLADFRWRGRSRETPFSPSQGGVPHRLGVCRIVLGPSGPRLGTPHESKRQPRQTL
jgi:hypothetical protein